MEFESKVAAFATGLFLLGSYIMLFDLWDYSIFMVAVSSALLLLVAFRDHKIERNDLAAIGVALAALIFFYFYLVNSTFAPLVIVLVVALAAINAKIETFVPALVGVLTIQFLDVSFLMKSMNAIFLNFSSLLRLRYDINDMGYLVLYHSKTHLPIVMDEVKISLPFYLALMVAGIVLIAMMEIDRKSLLRSLIAAVLVPFLFLVLTLQKLLYVPAISAFIPDNPAALALPLASVLLMSIVIPSGTIRRLQKSGTASMWISIPLLAAFFILVLVYYVPTTSSSDPLVIIDETNSEWEPTWTDYLQTYKQDPVSGTNNYFGLVNFLTTIYDIEWIINRTDKNPAASPGDYVLTDGISLELLENISRGRPSVLILKCVTSPYNESEVDAIMNFTAQGNGLILIGEHTDIYGMCTHLNPFSEQLGYTFLPTGVQDIYTESRGSVSQKGEFPPEMARYLVGDLLWETGCSFTRLDGADPSFEIITRPSYFSHYRNDTSAFFLTREFTEGIKLNSQFARHLAMAGTNYGDGKVMMFTDSTQFNNGIIAFGDHATLFVAMIEYVSSVERYAKTVLPWLILAAAAALLIINRRNALGALVVLSILFLVAYNLAYPLAYNYTDFPALKGEPKAVILEANNDYLEEYLSGMYDLEKLMDKYFQENLTALIFANPPREWINLSSRVEDLHEAITVI
ncbi:MAG: hypothetical protein HPY61_11710 [Methanotrichaceae archaeon]|nr:hypothetical protein [Methanotrichaceae archaeon]